MKKIIPFKKDISFNTNIKEIVSISLDHELNINDYSLEGKFILSGEYKMLDTSINKEEFLYTIPIDVELSETYILDNVIIDIDDFYYEIVNDNILRVGIDLMLDNIEEKEIIEEVIEDKRCIEEEINDDTEIKEEIKDVNNDNKYKSYTVYIVRENDTIDSIIKKYNTSKDKLEQYNNLDNINIGDKIIIP